MPSVSYEHSFDYGFDAEGRLRPILRFLLSNITEPSTAVELEATLDSGAERSLLNGQIGVALGLDVLRGPRLSFSTMGGGLLPATLHLVRLSHADLGTFELELAFSTVEIERNLLGRDFFDLVQVGFREHHLTFFVTPIP